MKKLTFIILAIALAAAIAIAAALVAYPHSEGFTSDTFNKGVTINGVDCSGMTIDEADKALSEAWNNRSLIIKGNLNEVLATYSDFDCKYDIKDQLANLKSDYKLQMALNNYLHIPASVKVAMKVSKTGKDFEEEVKDSGFLTREGLIKTENAYVDLTDPDFPIVKEVYGNTPDKSVFFASVIKAMETGETAMQYNEKDYVELPEIKSDNPELLEYQKFCQKHFNQKISYKFADDLVTIPADVLQGFYKDDMSGDINEEAVAAYVAKLADKYDTAGRSRKFKSLTGKTVKVSGGTYGWTIDQEAETAKLIENLKSAKDVERKPEYSVTGKGEYTTKGNDLGNTYVDVDITKQHVVYFKNGKKAFECDCVTGNKNAGHSTPTGTFYIRNHFRNLVLKGDNDDGTKYESPVKYWCGFYASSHGFHDASWRSSFGGSIYISNGSHGCINMPPNKMPEFYNAVENGDPVVVHK